MPSIPPRLSRIIALLPRSITLSVALSISLAIHAVLLAIHFEVPHKLAKASDQMLEVILVNARSSTAPAPTQAQARAQVNLDGGGNTDEKRIARTPLPVTPAVRQGNELVEAQRRIAEMEALQRQLMSQIKSREKLYSSEQQRPQNKPEPEPQPATGSDLAASAMAMARLQGQIERQYDEYNKRPRKKFIGARATEYRFAQYEEDWRQKIERVGNLNYPQAARGRVYGTLVLTVEIKSDGSINAITIDRSSGTRVLDEAAIRIVNQAAPFPAFPPSLSDIDIIGITRTWSFTNEDRLQAK
ncbi:TonB family protein [Sterolibacterium denitrificans]|uniref:TonB family protein n=1 Tax=Sterolibacterium denitrificans TaxID=157592 RepID=A0A7Z7MTU4_9PROT|nr:TonB family protein [Sterolibacterium denitrificans]